MNPFFKSLLGSFTNSPDGSSGKKLTAFACTLFGFIIPVDAYVIWSYINNDWRHLTTILAISASIITAMFVTNEVGKKINKDEINENKEQ